MVPLKYRANRFNFFRAAHGGTLDVLPQIADSKLCIAPVVRSLRQNANRTPVDLLVGLNQLLQSSCVSFWFLIVGVGTVLHSVMSNISCAC